MLSSITQSLQSQLKSSRQKVPSACQRCRRQKLKCDIQRPCTLCVRASVACSTAQIDIWKHSKPTENSSEFHGDESSGSHGRPTKKARLAVTKELEIPATSPRQPTSLEPVVPDRTDPGCRLLTEKVGAGELLWSSSSSAMTFVEEAFHQQDKTSPAGPETSAFTAAQWARRETASVTKPARVLSSSAHESGIRLHKADSSRRHVSRLRMAKEAEEELSSLLPQLDVVMLLVDNYFHRIHWFILVFHQSEFRSTFQQLFEKTFPQRAGETSLLGFVSVLIAVCVVSLSYTTSEQRERLVDYDIDGEVLQDKLLRALKLRFLDIVSLGSVEAVQSCVLLGSFHIFHGEPELAWPICGSGLRIAQTLNLHRRSSLSIPKTPDLDDPTQRAEETRKRCWWAVYEMETFCSMLYGCPLSITDNDCDVSFIDPYAMRSSDPSWDAATCRSKGQPTLLSYKYFMTKLSIIVKVALTDLYGLRKSIKSSVDNSPHDLNRRLQSLIAKIAELDQELHLWYEGLPERLRPDGTVVPGATKFSSTHSTGSANTSNPGMEDNLFQLQALALKLAFENARILVHRPLLSYKMTLFNSTKENISRAQDPFQCSVEACRDAALNISNIESMPIFRQATYTYAISFVSLHLFTAGVALSIMTNIDSLSQGYHDTKAGLRRLMAMQYRLKPRSIVAEQGFNMLTSLISLIISKEIKKTFDFESDTEQSDAEQPRSRSSPRPPDRMEKGVSLLRPIDATSFQSSSSPSTVPLSNSGTSLSTEIVSTAPYSVYRDPTIEESLLEFEEAINYNLNDFSPEARSSFGGDILAGNPFNNQDQGWIWGIDWDH